MAEVLQRIARDLCAPPCTVWPLGKKLPSQRGPACQSLLVTCARWMKNGPGPSAKEDPRSLTRVRASHERQASGATLSVPSGGWRTRATVSWVRRVSGSGVVECWSGCVTAKASWARRVAADPLTLDLF
jgi:hypothetical protein